MYHSSKIGPCLVAASLAATLFPAVAHAQGAPPEVPPGPSSATQSAPHKPAASRHPDAPPRLPGGLAGPISPTKPVGPARAVPKPDSSGRRVRHEVVSAARSRVAVSALDGKNSVSFSRFTDGDMIVVFDLSSVTGHAGLFDRRYYTGLSSLAVWSANVAPANGVQRESCEKFRAYDQAYGLWVPSEANHGVQARDFAARQVRKPYSVFAAKTDYGSFYCSKLAWAAWRNTSGLDLDGDGGYWVWPVDLINSRYTTTFGVWA